MHSYQRLQKAKTTKQLNRGLKRDDHTKILYENTEWRRCNMSYLTCHAGTRGKVNAANKSMLSGHTFRKSEGRFKSHKNENIDTTKTHENIDFLFHRGEPTHLSVEELIDLRIEEDYTRKHPPRKNAVLAREIIIQPSVDVFDGLNELETRERMKDFVSNSLGWFEEEFSTNNILGGSIHFDESNPHAHIWIMPMTEDGGLVQKEFFRGPGGLARMHKEYREHMNNLGWGFETENKYENAEHFDYEMMQKHGETITTYREEIKTLEGEKQLKAEEFKDEVIKVSDDPLIRSEAEIMARESILEDMMPKYRAKVKKDVQDEYKDARVNLQQKAERVNEVYNMIGRSILKSRRLTDYQKKNLVNYMKTGETYVGYERDIENAVDFDEIYNDLADEPDLEV